MAHEQMKFMPERDDFSIFLQGDLIREAGLDKQEQLEWVLKNRNKFREMITSHPELKDMYTGNRDATLKLAQKLMGEVDITPDESLKEELAN